jgi:hypothetical protein
MFFGKMSGALESLFNELEIFYDEKMEERRLTKSLTNKKKSEELFPIGKYCIYFDNKIIYIEVIVTRKYLTPMYNVRYIEKICRINKFLEKNKGNNICVFIILEGSVEDVKIIKEDTIIWINNIDTRNIINTKNFDETVFVLNSFRKNI